MSATTRPPCPICATGHRDPGTTTLTLGRGDATIVIRGVPAEVCDTCGNAVLSDAVARETRQLAETAIAAGVKHEVRDYIGKVA